MFGQVFGTATLITIGAGAGKVLGTIAGAAFGEFCGNKLFDREYSIIENLGETILNELFGLIYDFIQWGLKT